MIKKFFQKIQKFGSLYMSPEISSYFDRVQNYL